MRERVGAAHLYANGSGFPSSSLVNESSDESERSHPTAMHATAAKKQPNAAAAATLAIVAAARLLLLLDAAEPRA